jgi:hypothetical protein
MLRFNRSGMTLVETMVGLGVALVLILGVMQAITFSQRAARSTGMSNDWNGLLSELRLVLGNDVACKQAFGTYSIATAGTGITVPVPQITINSGVIAQTGKPDTGLRVTEMHLMPDFTTFAPVFDSTGAMAGWIRMFVSLYVEAVKTLGPGETTAVGNSSFAKDLRFAALVEVATAKVAECGSEVSPRQMCYEMGGDYSTATSPHCQLKKYLRECHVAAGGCPTGETVLSVSGAVCGSTWMGGFDVSPTGQVTLNCGNVSTPTPSASVVCCKQ